MIESFPVALTGLSASIKKPSAQVLRADGDAYIRANFVPLLESLVVERLCQASSVTSSALNKFTCNDRCDFPNRKEDGGDGEFWECALAPGVWESAWGSTEAGRVALVVLFNQLCRNAFRGSARMFRYDGLPERSHLVYSTRVSVVEGSSSVSFGDYHGLTACSF